MSLRTPGFRHCFAVQSCDSQPKSPSWIYHSHYPFRPGVGKIQLADKIQSSLWKAPLYPAQVQGTSFTTPRCTAGQGWHDGHSGLIRSQSVGATSHCQAALLPSCTVLVPMHTFAGVGASSRVCIQPPPFLLGWASHNPSCGEWILAQPCSTQPAPRPHSPPAFGSIPSPSQVHPPCGGPQPFRKFW